MQMQSLPSYPPYSTRGYSLRKFAETIGVSPTYLSQVEQGRFDPPTAERVEQIAKLLGEDAETMIRMAGRAPNDLPPLLLDEGMPELMRAAHGLSPEQRRELAERARMLVTEMR